MLEDAVARIQLLMFQSFAVWTLLVWTHPRWVELSGID